jgi:hypothetical protein
VVSLAAEDRFDEKGEYDDWSFEFRSRNRYILLSFYRCLFCSKNEREDYSTTEQRNWIQRLCA